jgi:fructokinase
VRIGIDLGGTKTEGIVMGPDSRILQRERVPTRPEYAGQIDNIVALVERLEAQAGRKNLRVGIGTPGTVSPASGLMKNCNSTCLNGQPFHQDIERALAREVRLANDADCFALSEASDGAAAGAPVVFGVILGTGVGGGICVNGRLLHGPNAIAGEWGHNPLPWPRPEWNEVPGPLHWDGRHGPVEAYCSGTGMARDHRQATGETLGADEIVVRAGRGDAACMATLARFEDRLARALAHVINLLDPHVIVLGGGVSQVPRLYQNIPKLWDSWVFSDRVDTRLLPAQHGDSSGVRGAAWLWREGE